MKMAAMTTTSSSESGGLMSDVVGLNPRLLPAEGTGRAARRLFGELTDFVSGQLALAECAGPGSESAEKAVHESRKALKQARALLRLFRAGLTKKQYARANQALRDTGRQLAGLRDAAVVIETAIRLRESADPSLMPAFDTLIARLQADYEALHATSATDSFDAARQCIARFAKQLAKTALPDDPAMLHAGLHDTFSAGQAAFRVGYSEPDSHLFHEWRKDVKYLWNQLRVLVPIWPLPLEALNGEWSRLSGWLGLENDLAVLATFSADFPPILALISAEQARLRLLARPLGARLYAGEAQAFAAQIVTWYTLWLEEPPLAAWEAGQMAGILRGVCDDSADAEELLTEQPPAC
jgi:CHAD domain-containing protein